MVATRRKNYSYIQPFVISSISVIKEMTGIKVARKGVFVTRGKKSSGGVGIILDIFGDVTGKVVYEFPRMLTMRISTKMLKENQIVSADKAEFKQLLESAILELGNIITGNALRYLNENGFSCDISTPRFYLGKDVNIIPFYYTNFSVNFTSNFGDFTINLALSEKKI